MAPSLASLEDQVQQAITLYHESKTLQSSSLLLKVEDFIQSAEDDKEQLAALKTRINSDPAVKKIMAEAQRVSNLRETLSNDDQWTVTSVTESGVRTLFRQDEETHPFHLFRVEGYVDAPLLDLLAILCEIDLWPQWMIPQTWVCGLRDAKILGFVSPTHFLCYLAATMPWPVTHRDLCLEVKAVDCMDAHEKYKRQIVVLLNSCNEFPGISMPPEDSYVRADVKSSGILLTPEIPEDGGPITRTHVQLVICANPKVTYLPPWILNLFMKNLVFLFLPALRNRVPEVRKPDSIYKERIANSPELYKFLERRMQECFPPTASPLPSNI